MRIKIVLAVCVAAVLLPTIASAQIPSSEQLKAVFSYVKDHGGESHDVALRAASARIHDDRLEITQPIRPGFFISEADDACSVEIDFATFTRHGECRTTAENFVMFGNLITVADDLANKRELVKLTEN